MLKPGTYWVGDLRYVFLDNSWEDLSNKVEYSQFGEYVLDDDRQYCIYGTKFGSGVFYDNFDREYYSVSGSLGCIELAHRKNFPLAVPTVGHIIRFNTHFQTGYLDDSECIIFFGDLEINTTLIGN